LRGSIALAFAAVALCGCSTSYSRNQPPLVDMRGVDASRYNNDLGECTQKKIDAPF
jgi:hypothetical protein